MKASKLEQSHQPIGNMYSPRPIPVLTGQSAERFEQMRIEAERPDAPKIDLRPFRAAYEKIMARSKDTK